MPGEPRQVACAEWQWPDRPRRVPTRPGAEVGRRLKALPEPPDSASEARPAGYPSEVFQAEWPGSHIGSRLAGLSQTTGSRPWECCLIRPPRDLGFDLCGEGGEGRPKHWVAVALLVEHNVHVCRPLLRLDFGEVRTTPAHHAAVPDTPDARPDAASIEAPGLVCFCVEQRPLVHSPSDLDRPRKVAFMQLGMATWRDCR